MSRTKERPILRFVLLPATGLALVLLLTNALPLGVPGEWEWARVAPTADVITAGFLSLLAGAIYVCFVLWGSRRIATAKTLPRLLWLCALPIVALAWLWVTLDSAPPPNGFARAPWVLYYPRSSGYFTQARYEVDDVKSFLASYEDLMAEEDFLHIGTHPPGLTLGYYGLLSLCESSPTLTSVLTETQPIGFEEAASVMQANHVGTARTIEPTDVACLWLASLVTLLAGVFTTLPVYGLAARHEDRRTAWVLSALWPMVPAVAVFFPKSDVLYAFPAAASAWLWLTACDHRSMLRAFLSGLLLWGGMMLSLAFVTIMALIGAMTLWEWWTRRSESSEHSFLSAKLIVCGATGFGLPVVVMFFMFDLNLISTWSWNFSNHALFYRENARTWWLWLLANPIELAMAVGLPVSVVAIASLAEVIRSKAWRTSRASAMAAFVIVWGLLWLSGKNMGEAARLWILLMPWAVLCTGPMIARSLEDADTRRGPGLVTCLLVTQLVVTVTTVMTVDGFHFAELLAG